MSFISGTLPRMLEGFVAEKAVSPEDESVAWVVVDAASYALHVEACAFLAALRARDRSVNTERVYAGRIALYLSYCERNALEWARPGLPGLARFLRWLVDEPIARRGARVGAAPRFRSKKTANAVITAVCGFLRFGTRYGWVPAETVAMLSEPKHLAFLPPGFDAGEDGRWRTVRAKTIKFNVADEPYKWLSPEQFARLESLAPRARDRFLIALLGESGLRIGEALGLRREDMHLLASSESLGCRIEGPHVHVRRRQNANGALAKSPYPRSVPVTERIVGLYADYAHERDRVPLAAGCDAVFVNLFRAPFGSAMTYPNVKGMFDRLAVRAGFAARPHMLRHTAATSWVRSGVDRDVVQALLGHISHSSMDPYLHAADKDKRAALERVEAVRAVRA